MCCWYIGQDIGHITAGCSYSTHQLTSLDKFPQNSKEYFEKWIKYLKLKKKMAEIQDGGYTYGGFQTWGVSKHEGHPNIQGASRYMGAYGHSLSVTKYAFFVLCMYGGIQTLSKHTGGVQTSKDVGIQTYRGCIQTYEGIQKYRGCPNIKWASKHMDAVQTWGHPNIQGVSKHTRCIHTYGASKCMGAYGHPLSVT